MRRRLPAAMAGAVSALIVLATVAGCGSGAYAPTPVATPAAAAPATANPGTATARAGGDRRGGHRGQLPAVLRTPGRPARTRRAAVRQHDGAHPQARPPQRRRLGRHAPARRPQPGHRQIEGFDIDVLHAVARALFGDPDKIELRVITAADRACRSSRTAASTSSPAT